VNFFDRYAPPPPEEPEFELSSQPRWAKPEELLGAAVAEQFLLARADDAAIGVGGIVAYPSGFAFTVTTVLRREDRRAAHYHETFHRDMFDDDPPSPGFLRIGVQFADGSVVTNLGGHPHFGFDDEPPGPILIHDGGGGGGRRYDMTYWVWPLPPPGPLTFVCEWPAHGIAESQATIDAGLVHEAAARAITLWDE
jgi:hypothetical protein